MSDRYADYDTAWERDMETAAMEQQERIGAEEETLEPTAPDNNDAAPEERASIEPTYDHRQTGDRFHVTVTVNERAVTVQEPHRDPFIHTTVTVGWRDLLHSLLRRRLRVAVTVGGDRGIVEDVSELDADYLGLHNSSRRREWNERVETSLAELA